LFPNFVGSAFWGFLALKKTGPFADSEMFGVTGHLCETIVYPNNVLLGAGYHQGVVVFLQYQVLDMGPKISVKHFPKMF
jgi:hypothetical protein